VGVDISPSMLAEARRNCDARGIGNVVLELSDDRLSRVRGDFDLVHSAIVLQHIEVARGRQIFRSLVELVRPGGIAALHLTYGKSFFPETFGQPPAPAAAPAPAPAPAQPEPPPPQGLLRRLFGARPVATSPLPEDAPSPADTSEAQADPQMLMNPYNLSEIAFLMQGIGAAKFDAEFTDHGGELGVFLFFRRPGPPAPGEPAQTAESLIAVGNSLQAEGRWVDAVKHWEIALNAMPDNATMLLGLAVAHLRCDDLARAETAFALLRSAHPGNPWGRMGIGLLAEARKQWDEALDAYLVVNREHPRHVSCLEAIVRVYQRANRAEDARDFLLRLLGQDPELVEAGNMLAGLSKGR